MKKIKHSKFKNTGFLFELLTRQITLEILNGSEEKAKKIIKEFYGNGTEMSKELRLFNLLINEKYNTESKAEKFIASSKCGASIYFVGTVRDLNNDKKVIGMTYDSHDALVIKSFEEIYQDSVKKFKFDNTAVFIEHIKGKIQLGDISILIAVACKHRNQAYELSRFFIEEIKKKTPIWKKEHYENEDSKWLEGNPIQNK